MSWLQPLGFSLFPHIGGIAGGIITKKNIKTWYEHLDKPSWRPKNWMFGPVWFTLYTGMGYASYLVYRDGGGCHGEAALPLALYGTQLALNWAWTPIFFGAKRMGWAFVDIACLWCLVLDCVWFFYPINKTASYLMMPYLAWVTLASALNFTVWRRNKDKKE